MQHASEVRPVGHSSGMVQKAANLPSAGALVWVPGLFGDPEAATRLDSTISTQYHRNSHHYNGCLTLSEPLLLMSET